VVGRRDSIDLSSARYQDQTNDNKDDKVFDLVEQMPSFPGGMGEIMKYLSLKLMYPPVAREMRVEADVVVRFTVDKTGFVRSPQVIEVNAKSPLITAEVTKAAKDGDEEAVEASRNYYDAVEALKEEAIHVVRCMPRWEPGRQNGKRVETTYTLPINFKLN
jgi:protein TonB